MNEPIEPNESGAPVRHFTPDIRYYRGIVAKAPHSIRWYRTVTAVGWNIIPAEIFSTLFILVCDSGLDAIGHTADSLIAGILPGSMTAHLYFMLVQNAARLRGEHAYMILAALGALTLLSIRFRVAEETWFPFVMKQYAYLIFAEAGVTGIAAWRFMPLWGIAFRLAIAGIVLRIGLGAFLFYLEACAHWGDGLEIAVRVLWAAETCHWPDDFVPDDHIDHEEFMKLMREYDEAHRRRRPGSKKINLLR